MAETDILQKLDDAFNTLSQERKAIVVPLVEIIQKAGLDKKQTSNYEKILNSSGNFKLDYKKEGILVNRKNFKPMEKPMTTSQDTAINNVNLHDRIKALRDALSEGLFEKDEAVRLALLTAIAGESIFFLGKPGCAKSMIARRIVQAFKADGDDKVKYFETLLNAYTTPDEIFGNVSLKGLNGDLPKYPGKEVYRRLTEGMLPAADIAFLDEIWKANSTILNALLTIVNERKFHNGNEVQDVPLKALFAASNELPAKGQGLEALYDRMILRLLVSFIDDEDNFFDMVDAPSSFDFELPEEVRKFQISKAELEEWKEKIDEISLSEVAKSVISAIRKELAVRNETMSEDDKRNGELFEVSDRRWKKIVHILKTSAFLNDRAEIDLMDCQLIEYCIWSTEKQQQAAREIVEKCIQQNGLDCDTTIDEINEQIENFKKAVKEYWFEKKTEPAKDKIVKVDNQDCYECILLGTTETWYVSTGKGIHAYYNDRHDVYDSKQTRRTSDYSFTRNGDSIRCWQEFTIKKIPGKSYFELKAFSGIAQVTLQKNFDKEHYIPIVNKIDTEIKLLKTKMKEDAVPFENNLFANQEYDSSITSKIQDAIDLLEDAEVSLNKERDKYFKNDLVAELSVGDIILGNGTIMSVEEMNKIPEDERPSAIAVVCITGKKNYAIGIVQYEKVCWEEISETASDYAKDNNLPSEFSSNWMVPNKDLLRMIWENREMINKSLKMINAPCTLDEEEYWSSSTNGNSAAFYQMFDETGRIDHTTKDHEYSVCVIREWEKE